jgi:hypothetical protein
MQPQQHQQLAALVTRRLHAHCTAILATTRLAGPIRADPLRRMEAAR